MRICLIAIWASWLTTASAQPAAPPATAGTTPAAKAESAPPPVRGAQFSKEIKLAIKPVTRLITALRMRMEQERPLSEAEPLLRKTATLMNKQLVYVAVVDPFGLILIASHDAHPDYGDKRLHRIVDLNVNLSLKVMRERGQESWLTHRTGHPNHYEILVAPNIQGKFKDHMIYYCVDLKEVCIRAERAMNIRPNEAFYLLSRKGEVIHSSVNRLSPSPDKLTKAEREHLMITQRRFLRESFGLTAYIGFARGSAEVVSHQIGWEKVARSPRDDWVLVFEEKLPVPKQADQLLLGTWTSIEPGVPLRFGILQEKSKVYLRVDGFVGEFRGEGRFSRRNLGVTSWFQQEKADIDIISFDADYNEGTDQLEATLHWEQGGRAQTRRITLKRVTSAKEISPVRVPFDFPDFPESNPGTEQP